VLDVQPDLLVVFRHGEDRLFIERTAVWFLCYKIYPGFASVATAVFLRLKQYLMHVLFLETIYFKIVVCTLHAQQ
jgi:hypothetical protein